MKNKLLFAIWLMYLTVSAQNNNGAYESHVILPQTKILLPATTEFTGLIGYSYLEVSGEADPVTINKPLYIIYNSKFCKLSIGGLVTYFPIDASYTRELVEGDVVESFLNDEAATIRRGWYSIRIEHNKAGSSSITINMPMYPDGHAYIVNKAKIYSEDGQVTGKVHVGNWRELEAKQMEADSIRKGLKPRPTKEQLDLESGKTLYNIPHADSLRVRDIIKSVVIQLQRKLF